MPGPYFLISLLALRSAGMSCLKMECLGKLKEVLMGGAIFKWEAACILFPKKTLQRMLTYS